jgi:carbamoyltransferase
LLVLGLNAYHGDASACLVRGGELVAAAEEERFRRIKHWAGFPSQAIRYCLEAGGIGLKDVDRVALNSDRRANRARKVAYTVMQRPSPAWLWQRVRNAQRRASVEEELAAAFPGEAFRASVHHVEHHLCHLFSAFHVSPFDEAVALSVDGFGDFASAAWGLGAAGTVKVDDRVFFPHSLGTFYEAMTQYLGFPFYGDEYKMMGLAPYGEPKFLGEMRKLVRLQGDGSYALGLEYFRHHSELVTHQWNNCAPEVGTLFAPALEELLGPARAADAPLEQRHKDIAHSAQAMYEEAFFHLLDALHARYRNDALCLAGGCAMNSVANGKVLRRSPFKRVYVQAAAGDAGGAIGAALAVGAGRRSRMEHAYWGPEYSDAQVDALLASRSGDLKSHAISRKSGTELSTYVARAIADGKVVGWFQGRLEWGPRALGNRSILADPRRADMKEVLNKKVKRRESFRPFAPSILREAAGAWFEEEADVPFMTQVFQVRAEKRAQIPAVTHVDGSGRLQTVRREANPRFYGLIEAFGALTGVPILLNTSFNENEPIVCRPEEALECFLRTDMDLLALGGLIVERSRNG